MKHTDYSENGFQKLIVKELCTQQGYTETFSKQFNKEFCINLTQLWEFIESTQLNHYNFIKEKGERAFLLRLDKKIKQV